MSNSGQETVSSPLNAVKWLVCAVIVVAGIYGNSYYANDFSGFMRALILVPMAILAGVFALYTTQGQSFWRLLKEARTEIRRVVWPTKQETMQTTLLVIVVVLIMSVILWLLDLGLNLLIKQFIG